MQHNVMCPPPVDRRADLHSPSRPVPSNPASSGRADSAVSPGCRRGRTRRPPPTTLLKECSNHTSGRNTAALHIGVGDVAKT